MKTYVLFMDCKGDERHKSHKDPIMIIGVADHPDDMPCLAAMGIQSIVNDPEGKLIGLYLSSEKVTELKDKLVELLNEAKSKSIDEDNIFDSLKELDVDFRR